MYRVRLPELGEGIDKATVACIHCRKGDRVRKGDDLIELVTDKASFNVDAEGVGEIKDILVKEGQEVKIGETLVLIGN